MSGKIPKYFINDLLYRTNIIDLINNVVRTRKTPKNPVGIKEFKDVLQSINIPLELVDFQFGAGSNLFKLNPTNIIKRKNRKSKISKLIKKKKNLILRK